MQVPSSILKKMAIGASSLALTAGAVYAVTNPTAQRQSDDAPIAQCAPPATAEPTATPTAEPTATPEPTVAPRADPFVPLEREPCSFCGMG